MPHNKKVYDEVLFNPDCAVKDHKFGSQRMNRQSLSDEGITQRPRDV